MWVVATNPVASLPNSERVRAAFARAEMVVVQDAYHPTETGELADVLLPAAQWSERTGAMTNSERRICLLEQIGEAPGEALPDWQIISRVAGALGYGEAFSYGDVEEIFAEYRELTRGRDLDITGVSYELLRASSSGVQWPLPDGGREQPRLFEDKPFATPDGRARFHVPAYREPDDALTERYPLSLVTGRVKDQWHTMTRTGNVPKLNKSEVEPVVEIHPADARPLGVRTGRPPPRQLSARQLRGPCAGRPGGEAGHGLGAVSLGRPAARGRSRERRDQRVVRPSLEATRVEVRRRTSRTALAAVSPWSGRARWWRGSGGRRCSGWSRAKHVWHETLLKHGVLAEFTSPKTT